MSDTTPNDIPSRVAVLEEIASATKQILAEIRNEIRDLRNDIRDLRNDQRSDFRWLLSIMIGGFTALLGIMAHGFHWL